MSLAARTIAFMRPLRALLLGGLLASAGCTRTHNLLTEPLDGGAEDAGNGDAELDGGAYDGGNSWTVDAGVVLCGKEPCACSNGRNDDDDDLIDGFDPECTGPYDNDEASFDTGEFKEGNPHCSDCFFDGNPTASDDGCNVAASCSIEGDATGGTGMCRTCAPSEACRNSCLPRTPNGCDCFGCCAIERGADTFHVMLDDDCSMAVLDQPDKCRPCKQSQDCLNPCGYCELCAGKTLADVPSDCGEPGGPGFSCDDGTVCSPTDEPICPGIDYCLQGCCAPVPI